LGDWILEFSAIRIAIVTGPQLPDRALSLYIAGQMNAPD